MEDLNYLQKELQTQDNECTGDPMFIVQQKEIISGIDTDYTEQIGWFDSDGMAEPEESKKLDALYAAGLDTGDWIRTGYHESYVFVQPFFTRVAAERFIRSMAHRLEEPRIYVESFYRNPEMIAIREALLNGALNAEQETPDAN